MMPTPEFHSTVLQDWLGRIREGDLTARDELLRCLGTRLEALTRKMLKSFPNVKRWDDTADVLQSATLRLMRTLQAMEVTSTRDFMNLAAVHIRRELIDLARLYSRKPRLESSRDDPKEDVQPFDPPDQIDDAELLQWTCFHEAVEKLPAKDREVVSLIFYHNWTQAQVAELLQMADRTVRRRWESALVTLRRCLRDSET